MAITQLNNRSINRSDTAASGNKWTATSATASDFQAGGGITESDMWRSNTAFTGYQNPVTTNWETADTDNHIMGDINLVVTDVDNDSEDADFVFKLMAGGAGAAE